MNLKQNNARIKNRTRVVFLLMFIPSLLIYFPTFSQTSGPTMPEYSSFEPIDVADMVNLVTGDFTYSIPLLEVPSPEGGYPLALSYHTGIKTLEEASWVGLGWSLSVGAISRGINGIPDDHFKASSRVRDFWDGGITRSGRIGVDYGIANSGASVGIGLEISHDTYQGFGGDFSIGLSGGYGGFSGSLTIGISGANASLGYSVYGFNIGLSSDFNSINGKLGYGIGSAGVGITTDFSSISGTVSLNSSLSSIGISISSSGVKPTFTSSIIGFQQTNNQIGNISTYSDGGGLSIPTPIPGLWINVGYSYLRYWMDVNDQVSNYGVLHAKDSYEFIPHNWNPDSDSRNFENNGPDGVNFDSYKFYNPTPGLVIENNEDITSNFTNISPSFPSYDNYSVMAQGLSGNIAPILLEHASLFKQKEKYFEGEEEVLQMNYRTSDQFSKRVEFRFSGDFSNTYTKNVLIDANDSYNDGEIHYTSLNSTYLNQGIDENGDNLHLAGSRHVEWYTNEEIETNDHAGLINCENEIARIKYKGFDISKQIGGFSITNESGVTYHFSLPVYNYGQYNKVQAKFKPNNVDSYSFKETYNPHPYAYTWLLTGITGPDYVDKNINGELDDSDWGYWIKFDYGLWADFYPWRTPFDGWNDDINEKNKSYSYGFKQIYYLDKVITRSHTALFIKEERKDGYSVSDLVDGGFNESTRLSLVKLLEEEKVYFILNDGNLDAVNYLALDRYKESCRDPLDNQNCNGVTGKLKEHYVTDFDLHKTPLLRLKEILVLDNEKLSDFVIDKSIGYTLFNQSIVYNYQYTHCVAKAVNCGFMPAGIDTYVPLYYQNDGFQKVCGYLKESNLEETDGVFPSNEEKSVIDFELEQIESVGKFSLGASDFDPLELEELRAKSLHSVEFDHVYSLCPNTINNIDGEGKLSLNSLNMRGISGASVLPPIKFDYDVESSSFNGAINHFISYDDSHPYDKIAGVWFAPPNDILDYEGSIVSFQLNSTDYFGLLYQQGGNGEMRVKFLGANQPDFNYNDSFSDVDFVITKNPPFEGKHYDNWGYYKSDYSDRNKQYNSMLYHTRSKISKDNVDAWSLRKIKTPYGSDISISYESDEFGEATLDNFSLLNLVIDFAGAPSGGEVTSQGYFGTGTPQNQKIYFKEKGIDLRDWFAFDEILETYLIEYIDANNNTVISPVTYKITEVFYDHLVADILSSDVGALSQASYEGIIVGVAISENKSLCYGGDVRVKTIELLDDANIPLKKIEYLYENENDISTGVTPYNLFNINSVDYDLNSEEGKELLFEIQPYFLKTLQFAHQLPEPSVMYKEVEMHSYGIGTEKHPTFTRYRFQVFENDMLSLETVQSLNHDVDLYGSLEIKTNEYQYKLKDMSQSVGNALSIETFDNDNNLISGTYNQYNAEAPTNGQGRLDESFEEIRLTGEHVKKIVSEREVYPSILTSTETYNAVTNTRSTTKFQDFDFYSGEATEVVTQNSNGQTFISQTTPAYTLSHYSGMGLKIHDINNSHMLTQTAATYTYKGIDEIGSGTYIIDPDESTPIAASIQTWDDVWEHIEGDGIREAVDNVDKVWRKHSAYHWSGDKLANGLFAAFIDFIAWDNNTDPQPFDDNNFWKKTSEVTLYNRYSQPMEIKIIGEKYATTKMDINQELVVASAGNARYEEAINYNFERGSGSSLEPGLDINTNPEFVHTGSTSVRLHDFSPKLVEIDFEDGLINDARTYRVSFWIKEDGTNPQGIDILVDFEGSTNQDISINVLTVDADLQTLDGWNLINLDIEVVDISGTLDLFLSSSNDLLYLDDFRFHPLDGPMTTYVYDDGKPYPDESMPLDLQTGQVKYILNDDNLYTRYEYDAAGRLRATYVETADGEKKVSSFDHNYKRMNE